MGTLDYQRTVIGYHGCDEKVARKVLLDGEMLAGSDKAYDWLGGGIYFWEHGPQRAMEWAEERKRRDDGVIKTPAVLGAYIHLGACFDLLDTRNTTMLTAVFHYFERFTKAAGKKLPENKNHPSAVGDDRVLRFLDCAVMNWFLNELDKSGDHRHTVRGVFTEGEPCFNGSRIMTKSHIQIAVRDPACILGFFRPPKLALP